VYEAAWKRFYIDKALPTEGKGWLTGTMLVLMTSPGRLLSGTVKGRDGLAQALNEVLQEYAKLPEAQRRPATAVEGEEKPVPAPPPGGLVLSIYDRALGRGEDGRYRLPEGRDLGSFRTHAPHGQRSSLWLTVEECHSLIPKDPQKGQTHPVPPNLARRIFLFGLWPQTLWVVTHQWQPDSLRAGELSLTVEEVSAETLRMRVHGSVLLTAKAGHIQYPTGKIIKEVENRYDGGVEGVLEYDPVKKRITCWDMAALGDYSGTWFAGNDGWKEATRDAPVVVGYAFEMDRSAYEVSADRRRPRSFVHAYIFKEKEEYYWNPEKWEADLKKRQPR
jgi:hypothetical protein